MRKHIPAHTHFLFMVRNVSWQAKRPASTSEKFVRDPNHDSIDCVPRVGLGLPQKCVLERALRERERRLLAISISYRERCIWPKRLIPVHRDNGYLGERNSVFLSVRLRKREFPLIENSVVSLALPRRLPLPPFLSMSVHARTSTTS